MFAKEAHTVAGYARCAIAEYDPRMRIRIDQSVILIKLLGWFK
jgi:hypothetical protein